MSDQGNPQSMDRRGFLKLACMTTTAAVFPRTAFGLMKLQPIGDPLKGEYPYRGWEDLYRHEWSWDRIGLSTHATGCVAGCAWKVYVKDGIPVREEQLAQYPGLPGIPDMNPRGCQKGAQVCSWI